MCEKQEPEQQPPKRKTLWRLNPFQVCATFEQSLRKNPGARSEDVKYLKAVNADDYAPLLYGLLQREIAYRSTQGDPVTREELESRFPNNRPVIDALLQDELPLEELARHLRDYECLEQIKGGPIGGVYKVRHIGSNELRMVRRISSFFVNPESLLRSKATTDVAHLFHTNITAPVELVELDGAVFVVMEYSGGTSLAELVARYAPIPVPVICEIVRQAATGVANMHEHFKAHEDIRPANIMVELDGPESGIVKIGGVPGGLVNERQGRYAVWPTSPLLNAPVYFGLEILSGRREPDTRSDVLALGMVLHHSLAGVTADDAGEQPTPAQAPPTLRQCRPDCPPELATAIQRMTAEDPEDRFESAAAVVDLLDQYADTEQLTLWIQSKQGSGTALDSDRLTPTITRLDRPENLKPSVRPMPSMEPARNSTAAAVLPTEEPQDPRPVRAPGFASLSAQPWKRIVFGSLAIAALAFAAWTGRHLIISPPVLPGRPDYVAVLTELPGPNGDWWFDEIPWFTPQVRAQLATRIINGDSTIDRLKIERLANRLRTYPDDKAVKDLEEIVQELIETLPDSQSLIARQILEVNPEAHTVGELKSEYSDIVDELDAEQLESATDWHLRATLLQASSQHEDAVSAYERALQLYDEESDISSPALRALCAADYAQLLASWERNYKKAIVYFRLCEETAQTTALDVVSMCGMADAFRKWGHHQDAFGTLTDAEQLIMSQPESLHEHPLLAVVHEKFGWDAFDSWQLAKATKHFRVAKEIRLHHRKAGNPRSWRSILWIEQGEAMTAHFQGNQQEAQKKYRKLLEQIDSSLRTGFVRQLPKQQRSELAARRPNVYERLGDCYLFGAGIDHVEACKALGLAIQATEDSSFDSKRLWPHILALKYKYAMALSLAGERESSRRIFEEAEREEAEQQQADVSDGQKGIYEPMRVVAQSVMSLDVGSEVDRRTAIDALEQYYSTASANVTRRNIDLVMLVAEELLKPTVLEPAGAMKVVRRLNSVIEDLQCTDDERLTTVYLKRYGESAQRALQFVPASVVTEESSDMVEQLNVVLSDSQQSESPVSRGLTRGTIQYDEAGRPVSCRLHVLTIGVSEYQHHNELNLEYADDDANALFEAYGIMCKDDTADRESTALFQRGRFRKLINGDATRSAIIEAIEEVTSGATENDLVVVSLSGHGTLDESGKFYFLPHDYRDGALSATAIWDVRLRDLLTDNKSNTILVVDACHSGAITEIATRSTSTQDLRNALHRFTTAKKGLCILAASLGSKKAYEDPELGHGVMTLALLEALKGEYFPEAVAKLKKHNRESTRLPGPQGNSGLITLEDIQYYICSRVEELSDGKQRATKNRLGGDLSMRDIPIRFANLAATP
ncbi:MAG: caspase family protein [Planctomycetaceae bacterium]